VDGNYVHKTAKKPVNIKSEINSPVDFPFWEEPVILNNNLPNLKDDNCLCIFRAID
jgi:hypothetical protein